MSRYDQPGLEVVPQENVHSGLHPVQPGLHPVQPEAYALLDDSRKAQPPTFTGYYKPEQSQIPAVPAAATATAPRRRRRRYWIIGAVIVAIIIIVIVIAVPVAVTTQHKDSGDSASPATNAAASSTAPIPPPTATANPYVTAHGAYNGSGMAVLDGAKDTTRTLIFQHASGQLRQSSWSWGEAWSGGTNSVSDVVVPSGVRNATALAAVSYSNNSDTTSRVVYVDQDDVLQDAVQNGIGEPWTSGFLGQNGFKVYNAPGSSLSINAAANWTNPGSTQDMGPDGGIKIYWPGADGILREGSLPYGKTSWTITNNFDNTIDPTCGFETWVYQSVTYLWAVKRSSSYLTYWYKNNNAGAKWTSGNAGQDSTIVAGPGSGLSFTAGSVLFFQNASNYVYAVNTSATSQYGVWNPPVQVGDSDTKALAGSRIASDMSTNNNGVKSLEVYFQMGGSNISQLTAPYVLTKPQQWTQSSVSVGE